MAIQGLGQFGGFYNQYKAPEISKVSVDDVKQQDLNQNKTQLENDSMETLQKQYSQEPDLRSRNADLENISLTFNANDSFDYIGKDASLADLDMMSAISDMQKDKVLEQYQYFVAPSEVSNVIASNEDGIVIQK